MSDRPPYRIKTIKTHPKVIEYTEREQEAIALRKKGLTYTQIGRKMGIHQSNAFALVKKGMERLQEAMLEDVKALRAIENERLDEMYAAIHDQIIAGDVKAIHAGLAIMERRAAQQGTDKPKEVSQRFIFDNRTDDELYEEAKRRGIEVQDNVRVLGITGNCDPVVPGEVPVATDGGVEE